MKVALASVLLLLLTGCCTTAKTKPVVTELESVINQAALSAKKVGAKTLEYTVVVTLAREGTAKIPITVAEIGGSVTSTNSSTIKVSLDLDTWQPPSVMGLVESEPKFYTMDAENNLTEIKKTTP